MNIRIESFGGSCQDQVTNLISGIQRGEFGLPITPEQQPDLADIPSFYQKGAGNFWLALEEDRVVGTIALLDIGGGLAAIRKMFVARDYRGAENGVAKGLLQTLLTSAGQGGITAVYLGTTPFFKAAHRFYEKNGFCEIDKEDLPASFPIMKVDTKFYKMALGPENN